MTVECTFAANRSPLLAFCRSLINHVPSIISAFVLCIFTSVAWAQTPAEWKRLEDRQVGYTLLYPGDWSVKGQVAATEFAIGSRCRSVQVIDFEPPPRSGAAAQVQHSFVQVCAKPIEGSESLEDFMRQTYGALLARTFETAHVNGLSVYQTREEGPTKTIFTEIKVHLIQIFSSVVADPEKYPTRQAQVEKILASFSVI